MNKILKISIIFFCLIVLCTSFAFATTPLLNTSLDEVVDTSLNNVVTNTDSQLENKDDVITFSNYEDILKDDITNTLNSTNNEEEYEVEENVIIEDVVNEDLHLVGVNINISSPEVNGDIFAVGENIVIAGKVNGNVYAASENVEILGEVEDVYIFTENFVLKENGVCESLKILSDQIEIEGVVNQDVYALSNNINIEKNDTAKIGGVLYATGMVTGATNKVNEISNLEIQIEDEEQLLTVLFNVIRIVYLMYVALSGVLIIGIIVLVTKKREEYRSEIRELAGKDVLQGIINWLICIGISIGLLFTVIGIPLAIIFILLIWFLFWKINIPIAAVELSKFALKDCSNSKWKIFFMAILIFVAITFIQLVPYIGSLIKYVISLYGFGFIYRKLFKREKNNKIEVEIVEE